MRIVWIGAAAVLAAGCEPDTSFSTLTPSVAVAPASLEFGDVTVLTEASDVVWVTNGGQATALVELVLNGEAYSLDIGDGEIARGESLSVPITFAPDNYLVYEASLVITSNDEENAEIVVPIAGEGVHAPTPDICVEPLTIDFGEIPNGELGSAWVDIGNCGDDLLTLGVIEQTGSGDFSLLTDPSSGVIAAGGTVPTILQYLPVGEPGEGDNGLLTIPSDDPDEPSVEVLLIGNGGSDVEYPIAVIDCPGSAAPPGYAQMDGEDSYDPEGFEPLAYEWSLAERPQGSQGELTNDVSDSTSLYADAAGTYEVHLVVENTRGTRSAPAKCVIEAIPTDLFHVELSWDTSQADIDLHVIEEGGSFYQVPGDCNWCNKNPMWGAAGALDREHQHRGARRRAVPGDGALLRHQRRRRHHGHGPRLPRPGPDAGLHRVPGAPLRRPVGRRAHQLARAHHRPHRHGEPSRVPRVLLTPLSVAASASADADVAR